MLQKILTDYFFLPLSPFQIGPCVTATQATQNSEGKYVLLDSCEGEGLRKIVSKARESLQKSEEKSTARWPFTQEYCGLVRKLVRAIESKRPDEVDLRVKEAAKDFFQENKDNKESPKQFPVAHALHHCQKSHLLPQLSGVFDNIPENVMRFVEKEQLWKSLYVLQAVDADCIEGVLCALQLQELKQDFPETCQGVSWDTSFEYVTLFLTEKGSSSMSLRNALYGVINWCIDQNNTELPRVLFASNVVYDGVYNYQDYSTYYDTLQLVVYTTIVRDAPEYLAKLTRPFLNTLSEVSRANGNNPSNENTRQFIQDAANSNRDTELFMQAACKMIGKKDDSTFMKKFCSAVCKNTRNLVCHQALIKSLMEHCNYKHLKGYLEQTHKSPFGYEDERNNSVAFCTLSYVISNIRYMQSWEKCTRLINDFPTYHHKELPISQGVILEIILSTREGNSPVLVSFLSSMGNEKVSIPVLQRLCHEAPQIGPLLHVNHGRIREKWNFAGLCLYCIPKICNEFWTDLMGVLPKQAITPRGTFVNEQKIAFEYLESVFQNISHPQVLRTDDFVNPDWSKAGKNFWKKYFCQFFSTFMNHSRYNACGKGLIYFFYTKNFKLLEDIFASVADYAEAQCCAQLVNEALLPKIPKEKIGEYLRMLTNIASAFLKKRSRSQTSSVSENVVDQNSMKKILSALRALHDTCGTEVIRYQDSCEKQLMDCSTSSSTTTSDQAQNTYKKLKGVIESLRYSSQGFISCMLEWYKPNKKTIHRLLAFIEAKMHANQLKPFTSEFINAANGFIELVPEKSSGESVSSDDEKSVIGEEDRKVQSRSVAGQKRKSQKVKKSGPSLGKKPKIYKTRQ
ncbi:MAG: hypothetical protein AAGI90_03910 [Chlamydiota bacterium]